MFQSVVQRVCFIPELLCLIFDHLDLSSNACNAVVCKAWSEVARDKLWWEVSGPRQLLSILAPITVAGCFERKLEPKDWSRFMIYAPRVRKFTYADLGHVPKISTAALAEISETRTTLSLLPRLRELTYITAFPNQRRFAVLFMNESVRRFNFRLDDEPEPLRPFFDNIPARMPHLTVLDLRTSRSASSIEKDLARLLSELPCLEKVVLPLYHVTGSMLETLTKLPDIGVIEFQYLQGQGIGDKADVANFDPHIPKDGFPKLWDLSLSAHLSKLIPVLIDTLAPAAKNLTSLYLHAISVKNEASVHEYFSAVGENFPLIERIYMEALPGPIMSTQWSGAEPEFEVLTLDTLKPLFDCPHLDTFVLMYPSPLCLTLDDLETLTSRWPALEVIDLNKEPVILGSALGTRSNLSLRALLPFAKNCPNLRELGLYLDATETDLPSASEIPRPFTKLTDLNVGISSIGEPQSVAFFLSRICPADCRVEAGERWPHVESFVDDTSRAVLQGRISAWVEVNSYLPLSVKLRHEEKAVRDDLEREVEDLRIRNAILAEKSAMGLKGDGDRGCIIV
ncbi:hypothetical protein BJ322DRAFT_1209250 [Thelephora terrestris]|uniref:F-box domain-containing protein n=1 Tax=Thelephora terrestris TaxID=56493 RepID=A0A9P6HLY0_9AGAM|nr:hypothetical protein BJ322DRAFT_1209250 [Thelephora terrestris]